VGDVPTTTKRQAGAKVAVRDGETIILGGFISDSRSKSDSGIPGLKDIPWLGNLFRSTAVENLRTELIMLMRPTVLPTPEVAAIVATKERNLLSGVKQPSWKSARKKPSATPPSRWSWPRMPPSARQESAKKKAKKMRQERPANARQPIHSVAGNKVSEEIEGSGIFLMAFSLGQP
jgi:type II secretory pathway component GspD/PulD (secretin)